MSILAVNISFWVLQLYQGLQISAVSQTLKKAGADVRVVMTAQKILLLRLRFQHYPIILF